MSVHKFVYGTCLQRRKWLLSISYVKEFELLTHSLPDHLKDSVFTNYINIFKKKTSYISHRLILVVNSYLLGYNPLSAVWDSLYHLSISETRLLTIFQNKYVMSHPHCFQLLPGCRMSNSPLVIEIAEFLLHAKSWRRWLYSM